MILAIFTVCLIGEDSRPQLLSTIGLVALLVVGNWLNHREGKATGLVGASEGEKQQVLVDGFEGPNGYGSG